MGENQPLAKAQFFVSTLQAVRDRRLTPAQAREAMEMAGITTKAFDEKPRFDPADLQLCFARAWFDGVRHGQAPRGLDYVPIEKATHVHTPWGDYSVADLKAGAAS